MKIGIYTGIIPPPVFIENLVNGLAEKGDKVFVYGKPIVRNYQFLNSGIIQRKIPITKVGILLKSIYLFLMLFISQPYLCFTLGKQIWQNPKNWIQYFHRLCRIFPPFLDDLEIFHIQWAKMLVQYPEFIENLKCPVILSLRGTQINVSPLADKKLTFLYKQYFPRINRFHAVSQSISKEAEKYGADINQITVISPSVDDKYLNDKTYKVDGVFSDVLNIVSVGRCHWIKGYTFALDTMAILKKEGVQFHYTIIAGGRDSENIYYQIDDLGLNECVSFMNGLPHDEVMRKLSGSDLFLLPSLEEGISNAVMEAMALGVPVISTNCGGMGEVIKNGENGFLVPLRDPDSTAQAIIDFIRLDEKSKITIVNNARDTIIQSHLLSHQVARFKSLYSNII